MELRYGHHHLLPISAKEKCSAFAGRSGCLFGRAIDVRFDEEQPRLRYTDCLEAPSFQTIELIAFTVFLRVLEYYDGILILTSNRVGTFDEAFKSRIQVALYYKALTRSSRKKIWQNFLEMLDEDEENVDFDGLRDRLDELAGHEMNGRQIRNTLTTARQLAIYRKEQLEWSHLERALSLSTEFNEYLKRVQGHTDAQWALEEGIR